MSFQLTYKSFCTLNIWHGYHLHPSGVDTNQLSSLQQLDRLTNSNFILDDYDVRDFLRITPTSATKTIMKGLRLKEIVNNRSLEIKAQSEELRPGVWAPFIRTNNPYKLSFLIESLSPDFFNYTEGINDLGRGHVFYFSNEVNNTRDGIFYLNQNDNYINDTDIIDLRNPHFSYDLRGEGVRSASFEMSNRFDSSNQVWEVNTGESELGICHLSWANLPAGKYNFIITNLETGAIIETNTLYLHNNEPGIKKPLAVIEIMVNLDTVNSSYQLLAADLSLQSPRYTLWWQNRMTWWRYILNEEQPLSVSPDIECDVEFEAASRNQLITKTMQPLTKDVRTICFRQDRSTTSEVNEEIQLPNPGVYQIYPEVDGRVFSEVFLGALNFNL